MTKNIELATFFFVMLVSLSYAFSGSAYIYASAVTGLGHGNLTLVSLNVTSGNGNVSIIGPTSVGNDTVASAREAVLDATSYLGLKQSNYNFTYNIDYSSVSGPSGGLALTLLAVSALTNQKLNHNFAVTGTIGSNGEVGQIGGIYEKSLGAIENGKSFMLVPYAANGTFENTLYYIVQQRLGIPVVKVSNLSEAIPYAFGHKTPEPFAYNISQNYNISSIPELNISCSSCNLSGLDSCSSCGLSGFEMLTSATINLTSLQVSKITGNYSALKNSLQNSLDTFGQITQKGYLYSGANLAFLEFANSYLFANSNLTPESANLILQNVTNYCTSSAPPLMTSSNYEYVLGGEVRQTWAMQTLNTSKNLITSADTTDELAQSIYQSGNAYAWCFAANKMYQIAAQSNSGFVELPQSVLQDVYLNVTNAQKYPGLYSQAAMTDYKAGLYGAALYNAKYAIAFGNTSFQIASTTIISNQTLRNVANSSNLGVWPFEFSAQSLFYLSQGAFDNAYTTSVLASALGGTNNFLKNSFVPLSSNQSGSVFQNTTAISSLQNQISQIYDLLFIVLALVFVIFIILLSLLLRGNSPENKKTKVRARRAQRR